MQQKLPGIFHGDGPLGKVEMNEINPASDSFGINPDQCAQNDCSDLLDAFRAGLYSQELGSIDCPTAYTDVYRNKSNVIMVADYDLLSNQPTTLANTTNTVLFLKWVRLGMDFRF
jgi:hypothetical protein